MCSISIGMSLSKITSTLLILNLVVKCCCKTMSNLLPKEVHKNLVHFLILQTKYHFFSFCFYIIFIPSKTFVKDLSFLDLLEVFCLKRNIFLSILVTPDCLNFVLSLSLLFIFYILKCPLCQMFYPCVVYWLFHFFKKNHLLSSL